MQAADKSIQEAYDLLMGYRKDPIGFATTVLSLKKEYVWDKMRELCEAVREHQFVAVRAGHSVSKTYTLGNVIVPWFKTCFQPSTVVTTAPSDNQVRHQLWREIHAAYAGAKVPLGGDLHTLSWNMKPSQEVLDSLEPQQRQNWEKNFAIGFSTSPDSSAEHCSKMQGWHNEHVLVILDEACGILPQIWRTVMDALIIDEHCHCVAIGNPTDPESDFAKACHSSDPEKNDGNKPYISDEGWYVITIAGTDTPNYKARKRLIPGLASYDYVQRIIAKYGANGDGTRYRVKGLFPTFKEGTYYGAKLAAAKRDKRVGIFPWDDAAPVYTFNDFGDMYTASIFVQFLRGKPRIIDDYWDYEGKGLPAWMKMCQSKPYVYAKQAHWAGPDFNTSNRKNFATGKATKDTAAEQGFDINAVNAESFNDGIEAARSMFGQLEINKETAGTFLSAIGGYGKKKNNALSTDDQPVYHDHPAKTWHRHMADAYRHLAVFFRLMKINGQYVGKATPEPQHNQWQEESDSLDLLGVR